MSTQWFPQLVLFHGLIAIANLLIDFPPLAGNEGLLPCKLFLNQIESEYALIELFKLFPSVLYWVEPESLLWTCGGVIIITLLLTPQFTRLACILTYITLISFSLCEGIVLWFPWDCVLIELLLISAICPEEYLYRVVRILLFRIMFGFGKHKFFGAESFEDLTYTSSMACWQPLGTNLGWLLTWLPDWVHIGAIMFTFLTEILCPFLLFSDRWRNTACVSTIALMVMIQLTGHFGWFNTITSLVALGVMKMSHTSTKSSNFFFKVYVFICIIFMIPSQWNSPAVFYQYSLSGPQFEIFRVVSSWRMVHTYGVFPPKKMPMIKPVGIFEVKSGSDNNLHALEYHYQSLSNSPSFPFSVAPFRFPRFDYIYAFYSANHIFSFSSRLGPALSGSGDQFIESVARQLLKSPHRAAPLFKSFIPSNITEVRFKIIGLVPELSTKYWNISSVELDSVWTSSSFSRDIIDSKLMLGPNMMAIQRRKKSFGHSLFESAVMIVEERFPNLINEREWFARVKKVYEEELKGPMKLVNVDKCDSPQNDRSPSLFDLCHSIKFGGYMGCLTAAHLLPPMLHPPLCSDIMISNAKYRLSGNPGDAYSKIPISDFHYWILGLGDDIRQVVR
jgi:hypothetical protein